MGAIVNATFQEGKGNVVYTKKLYQYDRGVKLRISGIALPEKYQVHYSNDKYDGISAALWVSGSDVPIPDVYLESGKYIYVWIFFADDTKHSRHGNSEYQVVIPVEPRPNILNIVQENDGEIVATLGEDEEEHTLIFGYR